MANRKLTVGEAGWMGLVAYIVAVDSLAFSQSNETMSNTFGRWISKNPGLLLCGAGWTAITVHLWFTLIYGKKRTKGKVLIATIDPISLVGRGLSRLVNKNRRIDGQHRPDLPRPEPVCLRRFYIRPSKQRKEENG